MRFSRRNTSPLSFPSIFLPISNEETDSVVAGNFTGGGGGDLIVANRGSGTLTLLRAVDGPTGQPTGTFAAPQVVARVSQPAVVQAGSFFGDGHLDLAVLDEAGNTVSIYRGDGHGNFTFMGTIPAGTNPTGMSVQDVNGDGRPDLVIISNKFGDVLDFWARAMARFSHRRHQAVLRQRLTSCKRQPTAARSCRPSSPISKPTSSPSRPPPVDGTQFGTTQNLNPTAACGGLGPAERPVGATGGDTQPNDAVVMNGGSNSLTIYYGGNPNVFSTFFVGVNPVSVTFADLNGDGVLDMIVANQGSNDLSVLFGSIDPTSGHWTATNGPRLKSGGVGPLSTTLMDVNGDGIPDLVVTNQDGTVTMLPGRGQGFFDDRTPVVLNLPGTVIAAPSFVDGSDIGYVPLSDGQLVSFNAADLSAGFQTLTAPDGEAFSLVQTIGNDLVAVTSDGHRRGAAGQCRQFADAGRDAAKPQRRHGRRSRRPGGADHAGRRCAPSSPSTDWTRSSSSARLPPTSARRLPLRNPRRRCRRAVPVLLPAEITAFVAVSQTTASPDMPLTPVVFLITEVAVSGIRHQRRREHGGREYEFRPAGVGRRGQRYRWQSTRRAAARSSTG